MMQKIGFTFFILFATLSVNAQIYSLESGTIEKKISIWKNVVFLGKIDENYILDDSGFPSEVNKIVVVNQQLIKTKELILSKPKKSFDNFYFKEKYISSNQIIVLFEGIYGNNTTIFAQKLDKNLVVTKDWFELYTAQNKDLVDTYCFNKSENDFSLAIRNLVEKENLKSSAKIELIVFDHELKRTKIRNIDLGFNWEDYEEYHNLQTDISCLIMNGKVKGKGNFRLIYNIYNNNLHKSFEQPKVDSRQYHTIKYIEDTIKNKIYCLGFYKISLNESKIFSNQNSCDGLFMQELSTISDEIGVVVTNDFSDKFKLNFLTEKDLMNGYEIPNHQILFGGLNAEGNIILVSELNLKITTYGKTKKSYESDYIRYPTSKLNTVIHGNFMITCVNRSGEIIWNKIIPKLTNSDYFTSNMFNYEKGELDLIYIDNKDNYSKERKKEYFTDVLMATSDNICLVKTHIDKDGLIKNKIIVDNSIYNKLALKFDLSYSFFDSDNIIFYASNNSKKYQYLRLKPVK